MGKKVLIITGSPRLKGNTNALATAFASGAVAAGNEVEVFDAATANLNGCHADKSCEQRGCCGQKDDGVRMNELMREADVLVLASPVYWSGFTSQIKTAIDRFHPHILAKPSEESVILFMRKTAMGEKSCQSQVSAINLKVICSRTNKNSHRQASLPMNYQIN